jgi:hypothetical protein
MRIVGPFWREKPTTSATTVVYAWCLLWLDESGRVLCIEWDR